MFWPAAPFFASGGGGGGRRRRRKQRKAEGLKWRRRGRASRDFFCLLARLFFLHNFFRAFYLYLFLVLVLLFLPERTVHAFRTRPSFRCKQRNKLWVKEMEENQEFFFFFKIKNFKATKIPFSSLLSCSPSFSQLSLSLFLLSFTSPRGA